MAENNCMCQETGVLIFPCSGGSDVGELSDRVARKMAQCGQVKIYCLAGIGAGLPAFVESAKGACGNISIDGCGVACAKKLLEKTGVTPKSFVLTEMGLTKGKTDVTDELVEDIEKKISEQL